MHRFNVDGITPVGVILFLIFFELPQKVYLISFANIFVMNLMDTFGSDIIYFIIEIVVFTILIFVGDSIYTKILNSDNRYLNPKEFLPDDELLTLKQVFYLIIMGACFIVVFYNFVYISEELYSLAIFDIVISLYIAVQVKNRSVKNILIFLCLVPFGSFTVFFDYYSYLYLLDIFHILIFIYFIKVYYEKFNEYTNANGLGITILLLFFIIFISFLTTQFTEHVNPLDSLVMVSNAFTSNGYTVLGNSIVGKINSIFLVWGGYIISGAGTATLTAALLLRRFNKRFKELERLIEEGSDDND